MAVPNVWTRSAAFSTQPLLGDRAAFVRQAMQPIERGGENLIAVGVRQQVAGQLPGEELVVRQIVVERAHDPIAIRPLRVELVGLVAVRVGVAGRVEPGDGHVLAERGAGQQPIDGVLRRLASKLSAAAFSNSRHSSAVGGRPVRSSVTRRSSRNGVGLLASAAAFRLPSARARSDRAACAATIRRARSGLESCRGSG